MGKGRRYDGEPKLNMKKVVATALVFIVIIMLIVLAVKYIKSPKTKVGTNTKKIANSYISVFTEGKWGVINSLGETVIEPTYDAMITIPDQTKEVFICQTNINLDAGTYDSKAINSKSTQLFTEYDKVEPLQNIDGDGIVYYDSNALKVSKDGKYGLINYKGKELLACEYTEIYPIKYVKNSFITVKDNQKGLVDNSGNKIIENKYSDIQALTTKYADGYIVKNDSSKYGIINYNKRQVLECQYTEIKKIYGSNMYVVKEGNDLELINADREILLKNKFKEVVSIDNNNLIIKDGDNYGIIDEKGEEKIKTEYQYLEYVIDGNYIAKKENKYGIINIDGTEKVAFNYTSMTYMDKEGFIEADKEDGQTDLMNTIDFQTKCTGIVSEINDTNSFIKLRVGNDYKYYNFQLQEKSSKDVYAGNTLFLSKKDGKYGYVNDKDIVIVDYTYDDATEQNNYGYVAVKKDGKWGTLDQTGKVVIEPSYELMQNPIVSFIGKWHLAPDINANYYTDVKE